MKLRLRQSAHLARLLLVFFNRRVLRVGVFRARTARIAAAVLGVTLLCVLCAAAYLFLEPLALTPGLWDLLFNISTVSLILWVMGAFLVVKVLFINAEGMLELTYQLPATNRERAIAFLLYEAVITGAIAMLGFLALTVTSIVIIGFAAVPYVLTTLVFPALIVYLVLSVLYQVLVRVWTLVKLGSIANLLAVLVIFILLALYSSTLNGTIVAITDDYYDDPGAFQWNNAVYWLWAHNPVLAVLASLCVIAVLTAAVIALTPGRHIRQSRFLKLLNGRRARMFLHPYDYCLIRNTQTAVAVIISTVLFAYFALGPTGINPMWNLVVLSMAGLYHYSGTDPLRRLPTSTRSAVVIYARLFKGQFILLLTFAIPQAWIMAFLDPRTMADSTTALAGAGSGIVLTIWVSVVFPSEKDNPFSIVLGITCAAIMFGLIAIGLGMLDLPPLATQAVLLGSAVLIIAHTIVEIHANESRRRNEEPQDHRGVAHDLPGDHHSRNRRSTARAHVLDQR